MKGHELKNLRIKNCLTQHELGKKLHCSANTIYRYESGRLNIPDLIAAHAILTLKIHGINNENKTAN